MWLVGMCEEGGGACGEVGWVGWGGEDKRVLDGRQRGGGRAVLDFQKGSAGGVSGGVGCLRLVLG